MKPAPMAQLFSLLCCLIPVISGLTMTTINTTVDVEKGNDNLGLEYKIKKSISSTSISCEMRDDTPLKSPVITWQRLDRRPGTKPGVVKSSISGDGLSFSSKLTFYYPQNVNITAYICAGEASGKSVSAVAAFASVPLLDVDSNGGGVWKLPSSVPPDLVAYPGLALTLTCETFGHPVGDSKWFRQSVQGQETPVSNGSQLVFDKLNHEIDRSHYMCRSSNEHGTNSLRIFLRVKSPNAYLAPLIAIILQVAVMIAIAVIYEIFQYEKRRKLARERADGNKTE